MKFNSELVQYQDETENKLKKKKLNCYACQDRELSKI